MRKLASILLLIIVVFNFIGYRFVFNALQSNAEKAILSKIETESYDDQHLITVIVQLSIPYYTNWKEFERCDGVINIGGVTYHYVKEKLYNGQLILKCLPDEQEMRLETAKQDFFKSQNDSQASGQKKSNSAKGSLNFSFSDYESYDDRTSLCLFMQPLNHGLSYIKNFLPNADLPSFEKPPCLG